MNIGRRSPPEIPVNFTTQNYTNIRYFLYKWLLWSKDDYSGIPGGFKNTAAIVIRAGVAAAAGTLLAGWAAADHVHSILTSAPSVPLGLGDTADEGTGGALMRAGARQDGVQLAGQVRHHISWGAPGV